MAYPNGISLFSKKGKVWLWGQTPTANVFMPDKSHINRRIPSRLARKERTRTGRAIRQHSYLLMLLPALLLYGTFVLYPLVSSFYYAFTDWSGIGDAAFIGFENFRRLLFQSPFNAIFFNALKNNLVFFVATSFTSVIFGLFVAVLLEGTRLASFYRTIYFIPLVIAIIAVGYLFNTMLNPNRGVVNVFLESIGLGTLASPWLGDPLLALPTVILVDSWRTMGFSIVVFGAALKYIPNELHESSRIDGANSWQIFWRITLPLLLPTFMTVLTLNFLWSFGVFDIMVSLTDISGSPYFATDMLGLYFYRSSFGYTANSAIGLGFGTAIAILTFVVILCVTLTLIKVRQLLERRY